jgi:hypothetical protein
MFRRSMMMIALTAALVGCSQAGDGHPVAEKPVNAFAKPDVFPALYQVAYRAEAIAATADPRTPTMPVTLYRDGRKTRIELLAPGVGQGAVVLDPASSEAVFLMSQAGRQLALKMPPADVPKVAEEAWSEAAGATFLGACAGAGEVGGEWSLTDAEGPRTACVTADGVILRAKRGDKIVWETTTISRGPQDAAQFIVPAGVQVVDVRDTMSGLKGMAEKMPAPR